MSSEVPYNPYAADGGSPNQETPSLDRLMNEAIDSSLRDVHFCLPGIVTMVTANNQVNVQPMLKRMYVGQPEPIVLKQIQDVPVYVPRGTDYWIKLPVSVNDTGILLFSERSLDAWKVSGGTIDPADSRKMHLSDAIFLPGLYPFSNQVPGNADDMTLHNGQAEITLQKPGKFLVKNQTDELFATLDALLVALQNALVNTALGPQPFIASTQTALAAVKAQIDSLKGA